MSDGQFRSRSSSGPNSVTGLRSVAESIFSVLMSRRSASTSQPSLAGRRLRKAPHDNNKRSSSMETQSKKTEEDATQVLTSDMASSPQAEFAHVSVPTELLYQIFKVLKNDEDIQRAEFLRKDAERKLGTLSRRLQYVSNHMIEIINWIENNKNELLETTDPSKAAIADLEQQISDYQSHVFNAQKALSDVEHQERSTRCRYNDMVEEGKQLHGAVVNQLQGLIDVDKLSTSSIDQYFEVKEPIDPRFLRTFEDKCDEFIRCVQHRTPARAGKYPSRPRSDWHLHCIELKMRRQMHNKAMAQLTNLENAMSSNFEDNEHQFKQQMRLVLSSKGALAEAVEGARFAGVPCKSDGSLIANRCGSDSSGILFDLNDGLPVETNEEMSAEEVEQYLTRSRGITESWLQEAKLDHNPEQMGPTTPHTADTADFREKLQDAGVDDSISMAGDSQRDSLVPTLDPKYQPLDGEPQARQVPGT